ncbi:MAG TPA: hypothetical protein PLG94_16825 [Smithellaceae bacterium]|nr:hypothetical protein [Smithellaceae bacterium]
MSILCAVFLVFAVLASPASAQMQKVDEEELALTNASVTGIVSPEEARSAGTIDKAGSVNFTQTSGSTETVSAGPTLNYLPASGPDSMYYHHPWANNGTNQWYWGGGSTSLWNRTYPSR